MDDIFSGIKELKLLEDIEYVAKIYKSEFGVNPVNLSDWNPSKELKQKINLNVVPSREINPIDYLFSYNLPDIKKLLSKLSFHENHGALITHSGSSSIIATISILKQLKCENVLIICPHYFTVPYALEALGMSYDFIYSVKNGNNYEIPPINMNHKKYQVVWITNPVYSTGVPYDRQNIERICDDLSVGTHVVIDECLTQTQKYHQYFSRTNKTIIQIISPHKSICVNGIKFGVTLFPKELQKVADDWSDVWQGCLPKSSLVAIDNFLSSDFDDYKNNFIKEIHRHYLDVIILINRYQNISIDVFNNSYLVTIYINNINPEKGVDLNFIMEATFATGATFISGKRNRMSDDSGFTFRINLAAYNKEFKGALARLLEWLDSYSLNTNS